MKDKRWLKCKESVHIVLILFIFHSTWRHHYADHSLVVLASFEENWIYGAFILWAPAVSPSRCCNYCYAPRSSLTQLTFTLHGLNWRFQTVSLHHPLCLEETFFKCGSNGDNRRWAKTSMESLMLLMESFPVGALQLKACRKEFSPQLILCLAWSPSKCPFFKSMGIANLQS